MDVVAVEERPKLRTAEEIAVELKLQPSTVRRWTREGRIPVLKLGGKVRRYNLKSVVEALEVAGR